MARRIEKFREDGATELQAREKDLAEQIFRLRFQLSTGQAEALKRLREAKKDLARVKTLLRAQQLTGCSQAGEGRVRRNDNGNTRSHRSEHLARQQDRACRQGHQRQDGKDHCGGGAAAHAAPEIPPRHPHLHRNSTRTTKSAKPSRATRSASCPRGRFRASSAGA